MPYLKSVQKVLAVGLDVATGGWHRGPQGEVGSPPTVLYGKPTSKPVVPDRTNIPPDKCEYRA